MKFQKQIENIFYDLRDFLKSTDFAKAILLGIALTLPVLIGIRLDLLQIGIVITVGALLASPSDTSGSLRDKVTGILLSALLASTMSFIGGSLKFSPVIMFPIIGILMFGISYLSIFGFRASLISFSGLFALVLSFSPVSGEMPTMDRSLLILAGGLWYLFTTVIWHFVFPKGPTEFYLSKTFSLTADYLRIRARLVQEKSNRSELLIKLLQIQTELTETHETLRNILISRRSGSGKSIYEGKRLLIFAQLIDMLELAMANPVDYSKTDQIFERKPVHLKDFQKLLFSMADRLDELGNNISNPKRLQPNSDLQDCLKQVRLDVDEISGDFSDDFLMLRNLYKYQSEQVSKIEKIEWLFGEKDRSQIRFIKNEDARRFLTKESYNLEVLTENFNLKSAIFKHSLRIAVVAIVGYAIGIISEVQNSYWILLTIIVIMRPNFGLTKQRSQERTVGTIIGGTLAVLIVLLIKNPVVYGILSIITLIISFSMIQRNYRAAAVFITLSVVFTYALLTPDIFDVIKYRVMDTVIGTSLAIIGNLILWPAWEIQSIQVTLKETMEGNRKYFEEIVKLYINKDEDTSEYKMARKKAFLKMSNLNAAFQRMTQEPKSQRQNLEKFYEMVELNHTFLSSLASLGSYILNNPTTPASENFKSVTSVIVENLTSCETILTHQFTTGIPSKISEEDVFESTFGKISIFDDKSITPGDFDQIEEAHLIREQLKWLLAMSEKMPKLLFEIPV